jgi:hypothetical protein
MNNGTEIFGKGPVCDSVKRNILRKKVVKSLWNELQQGLIFNTG